jgi:hypothetical protein
MVLIPSAHIELILHYPVNWSVRHQTLMCCISAVGDAYCPLLIAPNRGAQKIFETGIRRDIDVMMEKLPCSDVARMSAFLTRSQNVFRPRGHFRHISLPRSRYPWDESQTRR